MDTTKQYIKMCRKAVEVQKLWKPATGDFYGWVICESTGYEIWQDGNKINVAADIWLPRQDQLQETINFEIYPHQAHTLGRNIEYHASDYIFKFVLNKGDWKAGDFYCKTMEQLWLHYVMRKKFNKTWNGKDWISVEQQNPPNT
jgi:hypothetical protein